MNALAAPLAPPRPQPKPVRPRKSGSSPAPIPKTRRKPRNAHSARKLDRHTARGLEDLIGLGVNTLFIGAGIYTLATLIPHQLAQHAKLSALRAEVETTQQRVQRLEQAYVNSQIPENQRRIVEEQGHLISAKKQRIIWTSSH